MSKVGPTAVIVCSTHRGLTLQAMNALVSVGYAKEIISGCSDTALARNLALNAALSHDVDVVVMLDDDIATHSMQIRELVTLAHESGTATSAVYCDGNHRIAAYELRDRDNRWLTGLGLIAIPMRHLRTLAERSVPCSHSQGELRAVTWSGSGKFEGCGEYRWISEDYRLCLRLGGVALAPIAVGHVKSSVLMPSESSMAELFGGQNENRD